MKKLPPITHVAMRFGGQVWSLPRPYRHHHVIRTIVWLDTTFGQGKVDSVDAYGDNQGFLDSDGNYLTREQAFLNAQANDQTKPGHPTVDGTLFSEDVW